MSVELTGEWTCSRMARYRGRGRVTLGNLIADNIDPLPPYESWALTLPGPRWYRTKSGRPPKALNGTPEGSIVTVRATVTDWGNGRGGYWSNVKLLNVEASK